MLYARIPGDLSPSHEECAFNAGIPFDTAHAPGAYVCNWNGFLLRVPAQAAAVAGHVNLIGSEPLFVTRISDDPDLPLAEARERARENHLAIAF